MKKGRKKSWGDSWGDSFKIWAGWRLWGNNREKVQVAGVITAKWGEFLGSFGVDFGV